MLDTDARDAARAFSLTQPPSGFVDDPYPSMRCCANTIRCTNWPRARCC